MKFPILLFFSFVFSQNVFAQDTLVIQQRAKQVLENCISGNFNNVVKYFDKDFSYRVGAEKLAQTWDLIEHQIGKVKPMKVRDMYTEQSDTIINVYQTCNFEKKDMDLKLQFNNSNNIVAFLFSPPSARFSYKAPSWVAPGKVREKDIVIPSADLMLHGKLTIPTEGSSFPVVILIQDAGPQDMDFTIGPNKIFKDIALSLASSGFAVIRFEKRTKAYMAEMMNMLSFMTPDDEIVQDALAAIAYADTCEFIDNNKIFILGHGIGGMMAPQIAAKSKKVKGLIMMAANAKPVQQMIVEEYKYLSDADTSLRKSYSDMILKANLVSSDKYTDSTDVSLLPLGMGAPYWRYLANYDKFKTAVNCKVPILIMQAERDYKVTSDDYKIWQEKLKDRPETTFESFPQLNHYFISGTGNSYPVEFNKRSNVSKVVTDSIIKWMQKYAK